MRPVCLLSLCLLSGCDLIDPGGAETDTDADTDTDTDVDTDTDTDGPPPTTAQIDVGEGLVPIRSAIARIEGVTLYLNYSTSSNYCGFETGQYPGSDCEQICAFMADHSESGSLVTGLVRFERSGLANTIESGNILDLGADDAPFASATVYDTSLAADPEQCLALCDDTTTRFETANATGEGTQIVGVGAVTSTVNADFGLDGVLSGVVTTQTCIGF